MDFLRQHQLNIMLVLSGICGIIAVFICISRTLAPKRKRALLLLSIASMLILIFDRFAYLYRGDVSTLGYYMVRISNFMVFFLSLFALFSYNLYFSDLITQEGKLNRVPKRILACNSLFVLGVIMLILSRFLGLYYTFDEMNRYQRAPGFAISYIIPFVMMVLQFSAIVSYYKRMRRLIRVALLLFSSVTILASVIQAFSYGVSLINIATASMAVVVYVLSLVDMNHTVEEANRLRIEYLENMRKSSLLLFDQTATALASAIDAKDAYTHGHSARVADYSKKIAMDAGKTEEECEEIYYAALLHDVGKIGTPDEIINKKGKLTPEEYEVIKQHTVLGAQILSSITEYPYLSIGARYHHERYDGKGYPERLKGDDIPEIARIIAVADAYDAMTSSRSYRNKIPQQAVREEFIKNSGSQFDPKFARVMQHLIDLDTEFELKEQEDVRELGGKKELICDGYRSACSEGILVNEFMSTITMTCSPYGEDPEAKPLPALILFDSLDGRIYDEEASIKELNYFEYGEIWLDGHTISSGARKMQTHTEHFDKGEELPEGVDPNNVEYTIQAVKCKDHVMLKISSRLRKMECIVALPDSSRFVYIGLTGEHCRISKVSIQKSEEKIGDDYIPRIAEEVSYIDRIQGDVPNVQVNGYRTAATEGIPITDGLKITFHSMSLPTARLIWHCPFMVVYTSKNGQVGGEGYREFALIRLDGEYWEIDDKAENNILVHKTDEFTDWETWKAMNKKGFDCAFSFSRKGNKIVTDTENGGISIKNVTVVKDGTKDLYCALTGDQVALTEIRIREE